MAHRLHNFPHNYHAPDAPGTYKARQGERHLDFWQEHLPAACMVYVLECEDAIKIGIATNVPKRISSLQTGNPKRLYLLHCLPGDRKVERALHRRLRACRGLGEWFAGPEVKPFLRWIEDECDQAVAHYEQHGELPPPCIKPADPRPTTGLVRVTSIGGSPMGGRWRTSDGKDNPVRIRRMDDAA